MNWMDDYILIVKKADDKKVLFDEYGFHNFNWLAQQCGGSNSKNYINLNDDLMDGPKANGEVFRRTIYNVDGNFETLEFEYIRK